MADLLIKEAELKQLDEVIQEIPTKWGFKLIQIFQSIQINRQRENQETGEKLPKLQTKQIEDLN